MTIAIDTNPRHSSTLAALAAWAPSGVVLMLIAAGALAVPTSRSASEPDALYFAASFDDPDGFARVVARMPHVDAPDRLGYTPLATAASFGRRDSVEMLLARGAAVDAGHPVLGTPLMLALANGHADVARFFKPLMKGAASGQSDFERAVDPVERSARSILEHHGLKPDAVVADDQYPGPTWFAAEILSRIRFVRDLSRPILKRRLWRSSWAP